MASTFAANPAPVQEGHQAGQIGLGEIVGAHPGVEPVEAEVDGIGPILHCGAGAFPVAGGGEQFRQAHGRTVGTRTGGG